MDLNRFAVMWRVVNGLRGARIAAIGARPEACHTVRISTDDTCGKIKAYVGQSRFTDDPLECDGGVGVCEVPRLQVLLDFLCQNGFKHHVVMSRGNCAAALEEAFGKYLGRDVSNHSSPVVGQKSWPGRTNHSILIIP